MTLRLGLSTPWGLWDLDPAERRTRLAAIVDAGIDHVFCADHVSFRGGSGSDGLVELAALSGIEPRLGLYAGVFLLALRHPMVAARQIATLAVAAPGRLTVGVGIGGEDRHEVEVCGVDPATRGGRTDAALDAVRRLLAGEEVDGDGEHFDFAAGRIRPVPDPPVPFTVGGRSDAAVRRAGRLADGWLGTWCSPRRFGVAVDLAAGTADEAGRGDVAWRHGLQTWIGVGTTPEDGRVHVAREMERFYRIPFDVFERYTPCGSAEHLAEALAPYVEAGATTLNLTPAGPDRDTELAAVAELRALLAA